MSEQHRLSYPAADSLALAHQAIAIAGMLTADLMAALGRVADDAERWNDDARGDTTEADDAIARVRAFMDAMGDFAPPEEA